MSIADKLVYLDETKTALRDAINGILYERGEPLITGSDTFRSYADRIWTPKALFANGEQGAWYDPSDLSTLFQDAAGTIPVTAAGDPVGLMLDKSGRGNHATQSISASRPTYQTNGTLHWLVFDGVDDVIGSSFDILLPYSRIAGIGIVGLSTNSYIFTGATNRSTLYRRGGVAPFTLTMFNGINGPESVSPNTTLVTTEQYTTGLDSLRFDGSEVDIKQSGSSNGSGLYIGAQISGFQAAAILFYGGVQIISLSTAKRIRAEKYFAKLIGVGI